VKLLVCDVEGTIFQAKYKINGTEYASTMWQPLAHSLGDEAIAEELETHRKWDNKGYKNYLEWVKATFEIHKKHNLHKDAFNKLINNAEYNTGVVEFFEKLDRSKYVPILVSGGFVELIERAQKDLGIEYGAAACKYFFDDNSGLLSRCSLEPYDFDGKYDYVQAKFNVYGLDPDSDWVFIGDGKNDVDIANLAPLSFGINAHAELAKIVNHNVSNFNEIYDLMIKYEHIVYFNKRAIISDEEASYAGIFDEKYNELVIKLESANSRYDLAATALNIQQANLLEKELTLHAEIKKRELAEVTRHTLEARYQYLNDENRANRYRIVELEKLQTVSVSERAEASNEIKLLRLKIDGHESVMKEISSDIEYQNEFIVTFSKEIDEKEELVAVLRNKNQQLENKIKTYENLVENMKRSEESAYELRSKMLANIFTRLTLSKNAIKALSSNEANDELVRILAALNSRLKIIPGVRSCIWHQDKDDDAMEYYFSNTGRVIVAFEKEAKPFVKLITFHHQHTK